MHIATPLSTTAKIPQQRPTPIDEDTAALCNARYANIRKTLEAPLTDTRKTTASALIASVDGDVYGKEAQSIQFESLVSAYDFLVVALGPSGVLLNYKLVV